MSSTARQRILDRLHAAPNLSALGLDPADTWQAPALTRDQCAALLQSRMEAVRTEVHRVPEAEWPAALAGILASRQTADPTPTSPGAPGKGGGPTSPGAPGKSGATSEPGASGVKPAAAASAGANVSAGIRSGLTTLAYGPKAWFAKSLEALLEQPDMPGPLPYDQAVETYRDALFSADVSVTSALGAIAETGALILWPDAVEPRLLSLVPPIHIVLLRAKDIHATFAQALTALGWAQNQPANALLISGPSKTADIELVLAFGVHGPKELVVLVLE